MFCYALVELFSYAAYRVKFGDYLPADNQSTRMAAITRLQDGGVFTQKSEADPDVAMRQILHPYVGYQVEGTIKQENCNAQTENDCYKRQKVVTDFPLPRKSEESLIIGVLGGSFADGTARIAKQTFIQAFGESGLFGNRQVVVYNLSNGGYKQPQQLMNLAYHYALGAEFDIVINLDGFNEMAASYLGYRDQGLHPAFPVHWNSRVASAISPEYLDLYSQKKLLQQRHAKRAKLWSAVWLRSSPFMNFIWRFVDQENASQLASLDQKIAIANKSGKRSSDYEALGPDLAFTDWDGFFRDVAQIWVDSSLTMRAMAEGSGAHYYHFLQPNQYIEGNKILSDQERQQFVLAKGGYGNVYKNTHSTLVESAQQLTAQGVNYHDLTYLFKDNPQTLYIDNCCHMNTIGYELVARYIVEKISTDIRNTRAASTD